ncbi:MAG: hypothetical protein M1816_001033 [Peltula sp. TS41687]|nr:MAG: hypothetical protein M1816_001033 [Peltula sp. TS41687]
MANVKDPFFWHRFSLAVHLSEAERAASCKESSTADQDSLDHTTESWLVRQHKKRRRLRYICGMVMLLVLLLVAGVVVLAWWVAKTRTR